MVQEALSDAAVRSAANTEGLSALVRQEQDAKNEIRGLRSYLQGETGSAQSPLPEIASQMRNRINVLDKERTQLQASIKAGFPGYERLVRPQPASLDEISQKLTNDEALIVVMPDANGINIWAVKQENGRTKARFHRVAITADQIKHTVEVLRQSLESISTQGKVTPFNDQLAYQTYQALLEPLGDILNDRKNWILAASGVLARLPFAVLQTQQPSMLTKPAWLIQKVSLTQTPSVSAWLSLRTLPRRKVPPEALIAWGDPVFNPNFSKNEASTSVRNLNFTRNYNNDLDSELPNSKVLYHDIPELPDTRDELNNIAKSLQADSGRDLILGSKATRQSVLKANTDGLLAKKKVIVFVNFVISTLRILEFISSIFSFKSCILISHSIIFDLVQSFIGSITRFSKN
jgi:hypothetical protein